MRQPTFLRAMVVMLALVAGLAAWGCSGKQEAREESAEADRPAVATVAVDEDEEAVESTPTPPGPPPTPADAPPAYTEQEQPIVYPGAEIRNEFRDPGGWSLSLGVDAGPQQVVEFYRKEAERRGWKEVDFQPVGPGALVSWKTANGGAQLMAGKRQGGGTNVELSWSTAQ